MEKYELSNFFARKLDEKMKSLGLKQTELADSIGVSQSAVAKWLSGKGIMPGSSELARLARRLNCTPDHLLGWDRGQKELIAAELAGPGLAVSADLLLETSPEEAEKILKQYADLLDKVRSGAEVLAKDLDALQIKTKLLASKLPKTKTSSIAKSDAAKVIEDISDAIAAGRAKKKKAPPKL